MYIYICVCVCVCVCACVCVCVLEIMCEFTSVNSFLINIIL